MQRKESGFTLIELILIILIFSIVASGTISLIPSINSLKQKIFSDELRFSLNSAIRFAKLRDQVIEVRCDKQSKEIIVSPREYQHVILHKLVIPSDLNIQCPSMVMIDVKRKVHITSSAHKESNDITFKIDDHLIAIDGQSAYVYQL